MRNSRKIKARCSCSSKHSVIKCRNISDETRKEIFNAFWLLSWGEKKIYVDSLVKMMPTIRPRDRKNASSSKRSYSMYYYLKVNEELRRVCKTMVLNTLDVGKTAIWNWKQSSKENFAIARKSNQSVTEITTMKKTRKNPFQNEVDSLKTFLNSLPKMESHYCRKETSKYYLLPEWTSKKALYDYYVSNWCSSNNIPPVSVAKFNNILETEKISLFQPKKDACEKCMSFKLGFVPEEEHKLHITKKDEARAEKENDKNQEDNNIVFAVDVQALLSAPKSNVSSLYYKSKLNVHNFCAFNLKTKEAYCYLWNETEGGVSAEEFASILTHLLLDKVLCQMPGTMQEKIIIYSDGCAAQNRNVTVSNALINLAMIKNITIEQKYLEVGHTQMEVDSMHASIEKKLRNKTINVPAEYIGICRSARKNPKPYNVKYLAHSFFKSFNDIKFIKSKRPGKMKGDSKVSFSSLNQITYFNFSCLFIFMHFFILVGE